MCWPATNEDIAEIDGFEELEVVELDVLEELVELDCSMEGERNGKLGSGSTGAT